ncbi:ATP-binding protein [Embleya sp. NBC_00896]|uniref:ATP-binding protein n=1 Tax=Embleya sp. NBC_00896 TaxID=2975961 RepID=UPI003865495B|nr:ATP-binding protein [Embleya sp. NBC_00896]
MAEGSRYASSGVRWQVPRRHGALAQARAALHGTLAGWGWPSERIDVVVLVACELLTNAHRHAGGDAGLAVRATKRGIWLAVDDGERAVPVRRDTGPEVEGGFGLHILDTVADRWGVAARADGKAVWAEIDRVVA